MPLATLHPLQDVVVTAYNPAAATSTGSRVSIASPVRGRVIEAGFSPASLVASAMTLAVSVHQPVSDTASNFSQIVTSTLGTFSSTRLFEGAVANVTDLSAPIEKGGSIQFTTSGGNNAAIGASMYAIIRRA